MGLAAAGMGAAVLGAFALAARAAIEFESSFAGVRKTVDATEAEFAQMAGGIRDMATEIPVNVHELNRIAEAAGQLGIEKAGILDFTRVMADLGVTTNLSSDQAASALARLANIMQTPQEGFSRLGATVVDLGNKGAATEAEIVDMGLRIAGAGQIIGLSEAEVLSFAESLASLGIEVEAGGSAISRVFVKIAGEVEAGGDKLEMFAGVAGMTGSEFQAAFRDDAAGAIATFIEGLGRMESSGQNVFGVLSELGLTEIRVRDALLRASGAGDQLRQSLENGSRAWEENTALTAEAEKRYGTTASQIQLAKNEITDAAISFGEVLLPAIAAVVSVGGNFFGWISDLPAPVRVAVTVVGALGGATLLLSGAMIAILPRLAQAKAFLADLGLQGGIVRGSLGLVTRGIMAAVRTLGPYVALLAVATEATRLFGSANDRAGGSMSKLGRQLLDEGAAWNEFYNAARVRQNPFEWVGDLAPFVDQASKEADELTSALSGVLEEANALGMDMDDVTRRLRAGWDSLIMKFREGKLSPDELITAVEGLVGLDAAQRRAAAGTEVHAEAEVELVSEMGEATTLAEALSDALDVLAGSSLAASEAADNWQETIRNTRKTLEEGRKTLSGNTKAALENRQAVRDALKAAMDHGVAVAEETGSVEQGAKVIRRHVREIIRQAEAAGISGEAIRGYIRRLNLTPKEIKTALELLDEDAKSEIVAWKRLLGTVPRRIITILQARALNEPTYPPATGQHAGGILGQGGFTRYHAGGTIGGFGLRGDEGLFIGQRGERVYSASQQRMLEALVGARPGPRTSGGSRRGPSVLRLEGPVTLRVAGQEFSAYIAGLAREVTRDELDADYDFERAS